MKKRGVILGLLVISVLLISLVGSMSLVSAGWFGDIWNKITGKATENVTEENVSDGGEEEEACPEIPISELCPDEETICPQTTDENGCPAWDCDACETTPECIDSDGGKDYYVRGKAEVPCTSGQCPLCAVLCAPGEPCTLCEAQSDWCGDESILNEGYCENNHVIYEEYQCPEGCQDGACIGEVVCPTIIGWRIEGNICVSDSGCAYDSSKDYYDSAEICEKILKEREPEPEPRTCAARISISFDKNIYYVGEEFKVVIETFDAQGNHLPHYPLYVQAYDYESGTWQEIGQDRTDGNGYRTHQDKMNINEPLRFGKNKIKIITKVSGCSMVEDITIIEIKRKEEPDPVPCGMGSCVPEPEPIDVEPVNISDERGFYICTGCEVEDKCYPISYRKKGEYCSIDNIFIPQIDGECDNNFECKSNLCISGECLTESFLERLIEWIKKIIGIEPEPPTEKACSKLLLEHNIGDYMHNQSLYGPKDMQVPVYSEDGTQTDIVKCCVAQYLHQDQSEKGAMGLVCQFDNKEDVRNSLRWLIAKERDLNLGEYKGEKLIRDEDNSIVIWTSDSYIVASGREPSSGGLVEEIADAYLKKYHNDFDLTEDDIPSAPPSRPWVYCTEEDEKKGNKCESQPGAQLQTDPNPENKSCEIYVGCVLPYEKCENIDDIKEKEDCYVGVAEMTGYYPICDRITSDESRKNKCYVKAAEFTKDASICEKITEDDIKKMCFELAELFPWATCKSEEDMSKEECHFTDDFEQGADESWVFHSGGGGEWSIVEENGNKFLKLYGVIQPDLQRHWDNYLFKFRFKRIEGSVHVNFRKTSRHEGQSRYIVAFSRQIDNLNKHFNVYTDENWQKLDDASFSFDEGWHTLEIRGYDNILNVYLDDELLYKYKDTDNPFLSGMPGFEFHTGGRPITPEFFIDDVEVKFITEEDVIYP